MKFGNAHQVNLNYKENGEEAMLLSIQIRRQNAFQEKKQQHTLPNKQGIDILATIRHILRDFERF